MLRYMLDTSTCIRAMRATPSSNLLAYFNKCSVQLCTSSIVLAELCYGAENSQRVADNNARIQKFVATLQYVVAFDASAAAEFGRIKFELRKTPIGPFDTLIAAHARSLDLIVVTSNLAEFTRVPGLVVEDWV